jgi:hypothetical protein
MNMEIYLSKATLEIECIEKKEMQALSSENYVLYVSILPILSTSHDIQHRTCEIESDIADQIDI